MNIDRLPGEGRFRDLVLVVTRDLDALELRPAVRTPHCIAAVFVDGRARADGDLYRLAISLLAAGAVYFVAGGPNAARVEDICDDAILFVDGAGGGEVPAQPSTESSVILTVSDEDVEEALYDALAVAHPASDYEATAGTLLVVCEDGPMEEVVRRALADVPTFLARMEA